MARQDGFGNFRGKLGKYVYYSSEGKEYVRSKPSIDKERVANDPAFAAFNENGTAFRRSSTDGALFRKTLDPLVYNARVNRLSARVNKLFSELRKATGEKTIGRALQHPDGKALFQGFEFNDEGLVRRMLHVNYRVDTESGSFFFRQFTARTDVDWPKSGTHVRFTLGVMRFDPDNAVGNVLFSETTELEKSAEEADVILQAGIPEGDAGVVVFVLKVWFVMKTEKGEVFEVMNGRRNGCCVVRVD